MKNIFEFLRTSKYIIQTHTLVHTHLLGLQLKPKPVDTALNVMVFNKYWELDIHVTAHAKANVRKLF